MGTRCCCRALTVTVLAIAHVSPAAASADGRRSSGQHAVFIEGGGNAIVWSANYDYRPVRPLSARGGFGVWEGCFLAPCGPTVALPLAAHLILGERSHHFEAGFGWTGMWIPEEPFVWALVPSLGYRLQPAKTGFFLRAAFTPLTFPGQDVEPIVLVGLSLGATFGRARSFPRGHALRADLLEVCSTSRISPRRELAFTTAR